MLDAFSISKMNSTPAIIILIVALMTTGAALFGVGTYLAMLAEGCIQMKTTPEIVAELRARLGRKPADEEITARRDELMRQRCGDMTISAMTVPDDEDHWPRWLLNPNSKSRP